MAKKHWGGKKMGLFTSYCKNCGRSINWFILPENDKNMICHYCGVTNHENDLFKTMMSSSNGTEYIENSTAVKRKFDDDELYQDEINMYADLPVFDHEKIRTERKSKYMRVIHDQIDNQIDKNRVLRVTNWFDSAYNLLKAIISTIKSYL